MTMPSKKKRLIIGVPLGCLALFLIPPTLSLLSLRLIHPEPPLPATRKLSWQESLGDFSTSKIAPAQVPVSPSVATFLLPEILSVTDAVERMDGWVLLDRRLGKIHFFNPDSGLIGSLAGEGEGPGELRDPVALAVEDSALWVLNHGGLFLDRFSTSGEFLRRNRIEGGGCLVGLAKRLVVLPGRGPLILRICPSTLPGPGTVWVEEVQPGGSLLPLLSLPLGKLGSRRLHLLRQPDMTAHDSHLFLGTWDTPCIGLTDGVRGLGGHRCLPVYARPATREQDRSGVEDRLGRITELGFLPVEIPDHLPWYDRMFATSRGLVVRRVRSEHERDLVLLGPGGESSVTDMMFPENTYVGEESILVVRDLLQGSEIQLFPNPWRR